MPTIFAIFNIAPEVLDKLSAFSYDRIAWVENPKEWSHKRFQITRDFSKPTRFQISIQKQVAFMSISNIG